MKTVGDFKKAGLVFVKGDHTIESDGSSSKDDIYFNYDRNFNKYNNFDLSPISEFAWRENTGVKPEFSGAIDAIIGVGDDIEQIECAHIDDFQWDLDHSCPTVKWRPSLNQPSTAESGNKESAIHKAWVGLKGDLSNAKQYDKNGSYLAVCIKDGFFIKEGLYCLTESLVDNTEHWEDVCTVKEFTSYCEKMAAEEKRMDIIGQNGNDGLHYDNTAQQVESLAVNDKPIFTQAMADAYKMPAIGSWFTLHYHEHGSRFNDMDGQDFEVVGINDDVYTFRNDIKGYGALKLNAINCTPIDTRTDREKAIDAALSEWPASDKATLEIAYDFWRVGESTIYDW